MKVYKIKHNQVLEVECQELKWPLLDAEGDTIYENTHFPTRLFALQYAIQSCQAGISILTRDLIQTRDTEKHLEKEISNECIDLEKLKSEHLLESEADK